MSLFDFDTQFPDETTAIAYLERQRWGADGSYRSCPHCGSVRSYIYTKKKLYKCADCLKQYTVTVGTIFEGSHIPLRKWFYAAYLNTSLKKGISSVQLAKYLGITQKSAWFMLQRIRYGLQTANDDTVLSHTVEIDEGYIGGVKHGGRHGVADKAVVFGAVERKGNVKLKHIPSSGSRVILPEIARSVKPGTTVYSDKAQAYTTLNKRGYKHQSVNHAQGEYARGEAHTNTIEGGVWSHLKKSIDAIYIGVSAKHLQKYCAEYSFRFNRRDMSDNARFDDWFQYCHGRLMYRALIADKN